MKRDGAIDIEMSRRPTGRRHFPWIARALILGYFLWACSTASAEKLKLNAEVRSPLMRARTGGPMPFEWTLTWSGSGLLEGQFVFTVVDGEKVLARFRSDDLALAAGEQRFSALLPALTYSGARPQVTLRTEFVQKGQAVPLRENVLLVASPEQRFLTLGIVCGLASPGPHELRLAEHLRFETFRPDNNQAAVVTALSYLAPDDSPADPLMLCGFDLLVLSGNGFSGLGEKQLAGLLAWIESGGSVCVIPDGTLEPRHVRFLNALVETDADHAAYIADPVGRLVPVAGDAAASVRLARRGLGRAVIFERGIAQIPDFGTAEGRRAAAYLWKVRHGQLESIARDGKWKDLDRSSNAQRRPGYAVDVDYRQYDYLRRPSLKVNPFPAVGGLLTTLKPKNVDVVPLSLIGVTLLLYVLAIGPLDYYVLGALKLRRLTWIVFPVVTLGFTVFALALSHSYLGSNDARPALEILDVSDRGRIVRVNRYEMLFSSLARTVETDVRQSCFTSIAYGRTDENSLSGAGFSPRKSPQPSGMPEYVGRVPSRHVVLQDVQQWSPQINRLFSIDSSAAGGTVPSDFDWDLPFDDSTTEGRAELVTRVQQAFGSEAAACVMSGNATRRLIDPKRLLSGLAVITSGGDQAGGAVSGNFLDDSCKAAHLGLLSIVSHISPTGGDNFEDLAVLDTTDPRQKLLVIVVEHEGTLRIYRKLYFGAP